MVGILANDGGTWKSATSIPVNNAGTWQNAQEVWANNSGAWIKVFPDIVREPATGENYDTSTYKWTRIPAVSYSNITWNGNMGNAGLDAVSVTIGSWTYYRGTLRTTISGTGYYGIYRIGTP